MMIVAHLLKRGSQCFRHVRDGEIDTPMDAIDAETRSRYLAKHGKPADDLDIEVFWIDRHGQLARMRRTSRNGFNTRLNTDCEFSFSLNLFEDVEAPAATRPKAPRRAAVG